MSGFGSESTHQLWSYSMTTLVEGLAVSNHKAHLARSIDGKACAQALRDRVSHAVRAFIDSCGRAPGLAVVLVGDDPASGVYVRSKGKATQEAGMLSIEHRLPAEASCEQVLKLLAALNSDPGIDGILVQLPLPDHIDEAAVVAAIDPAKDVDGFHIVNVGRLAVGADGLIPCTPLGCLILLKKALGCLEGLHAVVIGRSNIVGKPMAQLLLQHNCTVTLAHSKTRNLPDIVRAADIVVAAVGRPEMVRGDWIKPGAVVIDVGINRVPVGEKGRSRLVGDVAFAEASAMAGFITPVPGGVGPMTIACLLRNTLMAAHRRQNLAPPLVE
jgi:methylenetetrahydrofolate dehydrogenase (NADP+)/methenyltetrahydrofolate cyclohydrolase